MLPELLIGDLLELLDEADPEQIRAFVHDQVPGSLLNELDG